MFPCISTQKGNHQETNLLTESSSCETSEWKTYLHPTLRTKSSFFCTKSGKYYDRIDSIYTHTLHAKYCTFPFPLYLILLPETVHLLLYSCETLFSANVDDFKRIRKRFEKKAEAVFRRRGGGRSRDFIFVFQQGFLWHCHSTLKTLNASAFLYVFLVRRPLHVTGFLILLIHNNRNTQRQEMVCNCRNVVLLNT